MKCPNCDGKMDLVVVANRREINYCTACGTLDFWATHVPTQARQHARMREALLLTSQADEHIEECRKYEGGDCDCYLVLVERVLRECK